MKESSAYEEMQKEFFRIQAEYAKYFLDYYNKESLNAFASITKIRDELVRRIKENTKETNGLVKDIKRELSDYKTVGEGEKPINNDIKLLNFKKQKQKCGTEIFEELEPALNNSRFLKKGNVIDHFKMIMENEMPFNDYLSYDDAQANEQVISNVKGLMEVLFDIGNNVWKLTIIHLTAEEVVNQIIDLGAPFKIEESVNHAFIESLTPTNSILKPNKETIYKWYESIKRRNNNNLELSFSELKTQIIAYGLSIKEYFITEDPVNFDRAYRAWFRTRNSKRNELPNQME